MIQTRLYYVDPASMEYFKEDEEAVGLFDVEGNLFHVIEGGNTPQDQLDLLRKVGISLIGIDYGKLMNGWNCSPSDSYERMPEQEEVEIRARKLIRAIELDEEIESDYSVIDYEEEDDEEEDPEEVDSDEDDEEEDEGREVDRKYKSDWSYEIKEDL